MRALQAINTKPRQNEKDHDFTQWQKDLSLLQAQRDIPYSQQKDERLMDKSDIVSIAPGFYGRFKELMPAQAKEEELAIQKGKIILYESMFNLEADERMKEEAAIDRMTMEYERD